MPLLARMSITHRATGVFLTLCAILIPILLVAVAAGPNAYECLREQLSAWYGQLLLFAISASLIYHLLNGVRYLVWAAARNLDVPAAEKSGVAIIVLSVILTAALWMVA
jgi:succinate dehydrogenase / fumarate reductase cytochrome b subunit